MGRNKKFSEPSKVLTIRVPESRYSDIKNIVDNILKNDNGDLYRIRNKNNKKTLKYLKFLNEFFKDNVDYLIKNEFIQDFIINHEEFDTIEEVVNQDA